MAGQQVSYKLVGIVVHRTLLKKSGHYVSYFRPQTNNMQWFYCNDNQVCQLLRSTPNCRVNFCPPQVLPVSAATVLQQQPYLLFYEVDNESKQIFHFNFTSQHYTNLDSSAFPKWSSRSITDSYKMRSRKGIHNRSGKKINATLQIESRNLHSYLQYVATGAA